MNEHELRDRQLALAWHVADLVLALVGLGWALYHWRRRRPRLVETRRVHG